MPSEVAAVRRDGLIRGLPGDVAERFFALGFSLEQMRQNLGDLDRCVAEWSETPPVKAANSIARTIRMPGETGSRLTALQTLAFHPPDQEIDAILAEERLVFEHESGHAPMA